MLFITVLVTTLVLIAALCVGAQLHALADRMAAEERNV